ncbi:hypothetical protein B0H66DRAFT_115745 [Apodospora peruviana]|uniref:Clock-controlled protein 6 n=1 Tax=Apodospora peruviana TaxID=516989 RepID=A0AAE0MAC4_9PEZI|nr:hypothetical protein B0H66DRAFT_115745 [Apodospora peruviana]
MKFSAAAVLAAVAGAHAWSNVTYTTEVVTAVTTYCPYATEITYGGSTYTVTEATTLTITDCPCTVTKPVTTYSSVVCNTCAPPAYVNSTAPAYPTGTGAVSVPPTSYPTTSSLPTAGAGKVAALSGAGLAGLLGVALLL